MHYRDTKTRRERRVGIVALELSPVFNMTPVRLIVKIRRKAPFRNNNIAARLVTHSESCQQPQLEVVYTERSSAAAPGLGADPAPGLLRLHPHPGAPG